ncbi:ATP-binding cassette domain-containing protein [Massilia sp. TS11]|uniref:ATP-binding cassette domain-containing protein n=1 Tax=Massilia sp. TS11 TaxID=2908003 RepID=UPI001ED9E16A|nr:ATP-binding cassette domain-containing protein [Massilia sp. TS11]MCG2585628.1 ATP-binding cassette domain-containing protein [Massilia sp. TS11]
MASAILTLHRVHLALPDGRILLDDCSTTLGPGLCALIGPNGSGKTLLAKILAGLAAPTRGSIQRACAIAYLDQHGGSGDSLAEVAGLAPALYALARLRDGSGDSADLELLDERWDLDTRWHAQLAAAGLDPALPAAALSGGQRMRLALIGAFCSTAGYLILDEPSNHLDANQRQWLLAQMQAWCAGGRGLLLISHDRALLAAADSTLAIAQRGLRRYGGGWDLVAASRTAELAQAETALAQARAAQRQGERARQEQSERAARKAGRGARERASGSQSKLLYDFKRERAEQSAGALHTRHAAERAANLADLRAAADSAHALQQRAAFPRTAPPLASGQTVLHLDQVRLPWGWQRPFSAQLCGPQRVHVRGPNGCGKSSLLHLIAGRLAPAGGQLRTPCGAALLDQRLDLLARSASALEQLCAGGLDAATARHWLHQAGIGAAAAMRPAATLSGGEALRVALLLVLLQRPQPRLLLLDEPSNHLDLDALDALEAMLRSWGGALLLVSHDARLAEAIAPDQVWQYDGAGWEVIAAPG